MSAKGRKTPAAKIVEANDRAEAGELKMDIIRDLGGNMQKYLRHRPGAAAGRRNPGRGNAELAKVLALARCGHDFYQVVEATGFERRWVYGIFESAIAEEDARAEVARAAGIPTPVAAPVQSPRDRREAAIAKAFARYRANTDELMGIIFELNTSGIRRADGGMWSAPELVREFRKLHVDELTAAGRPPK